MTATTFSPDSTKDLRDSTANSGVPMNIIRISITSITFLFYLLTLRSYKFNLSLNFPLFLAKRIVFKGQRTFSKLIVRVTFSDFAFAIMYITLYLDNLLVFTD